MKKIHLLPNILTALGLTCGLFVIFKLNMTGVGKADEKLLMAATGILLLGAFFDLLDGAVARAMNATSDFGGLFDSLSDAVGFGVAPSVIVLKSLSIAPQTFESFLVTTSALLYSVCGVLRLVRFNITKNEDQGLEVTKKNNFTGLPIPAAAAALVSLNLLLVSSDLHEFWIPSETERLFLLVPSMAGLGYLMISRWKFPSAKTLHIRVAGFQTVFFTVLSAVIAFYGFIYHFAIIFAFLSWTYLLVSLLLSIIRITCGKKSKTLVDFEPESEDLG